MYKRKFQLRPLNRCGAVAVEFAVVLPFLVATVLGMIETTRLFDMQNLLETSVRDGARMAAMDRSDILQEGQSTNEKLISDVTNFLESSGVSPADISVSIRSAANPEESFDLDDPANDFELFEVEVSVPFSAASFTPVSEGSDFNMSGKITFRNGRAIVVE